MCKSEKIMKEKNLQLRVLLTSCNQCNTVFILIASDVFVCVCVCVSANKLHSYYCYYVGEISELCYELFKWL